MGIPKMHAINATLTIAYRDFVKFLHDRTRFISTLIFPIIFVGVLGSSMQSNIGDSLPFNFITFVFTGVFAQVLFQSSASGIISLIEDRENDFAQELFITPVSRYVIILGKIVGEASVAIVQGAAVVIFGIIMGVQFSFVQLVMLIPAGIVATLAGGSFGVLVLANLSNQRTANQIFPFLLFPQYFLAGVFNPIRDLDPVLLVMSRIAPLTYVIDFVRGVYYRGSQEAQYILINTPLINLLIIVAMFLVFITIGTYLFARNERNR